MTATFNGNAETIIGRWEIADDGTHCTTDFDLPHRRVDTPEAISAVLVEELRRP